DWHVPAVPGPGGRACELAAAQFVLAALAIGSAHLDHAHVGGFQLVPGHRTLDHAPVPEVTRVRAVVQGAGAAAGLGRDARGANPPAHAGDLAPALGGRPHARGLAHGGIGAITAAGDLPALG